MYGSGVTRAIVFDLDGTLIDSLPDIARALDRALADHDLPPPPRELVRTWIGGGARVLIARAVAHAPELVEPLLARFRAHYAAAPVVESTLYPGLAQVLDGFVASRRLLAVLSNKPHELTIPICARMLARWPFAAIVGARAGEPLKPDPAAALALAQRLGVAPDGCAIVGDAPTDIATARAAGMRAVAVSWGYRPRDELVAAAPDAIADEPSELAALIP